MEQVEQPKQDLEHNIRALLNEAVTKMDLVSQDEIQRQKNALALANQRLNQLQAQLQVLESELHKTN
ncbi:hypothetical protein EC844_101423 [Acinetobacter calcoaceticus]|uniref:Membrane fusogenic activity n=1 Tax=Acinetobacter calcoaceticus TaxID=471 RepID=A0A4R1Y7G9_ACICA|nr:hypothetical protein EC844_101423 [Acinetobacter calcoaceticus]